MNRRLHEAVEQASETRAFIVLLVVLALRARNFIAALRPVQMLIPLTLVQIAFLFIATLFQEEFIFIFGIGNFIVAWVAILPSTFDKPTPVAHWLR